MAEKIETTTVNGDNSVDARVADIVRKLESKGFTIYFYAPTMNVASGGVGVLFKQARILKDAGYNVKIIFEPKVNEKASYEASMQVKSKVFVFEKLNPEWLEFDFSDIPLVPQVGTDESGNRISKINYTDGTSQKTEQIAISVEDMVVIPEGFPNIMQQLAQSPCKKIVLAQSWIYVLNSLKPGSIWQSYGITDVISVSDAITEYLNSIMPGLKIKQYSQSINRDIFNVPERVSDKLPLIGYSCNRGREQRMKTFNVIRNFQQWNPMANYFRFVELSDLSREEYAEKLKSCSLLLSTDEIAGFGTAPLEAMASGTHVVSWAPYGGKEYINENNGFWAANGDIFNLSEYLGLAVDKLVNGELDNPEIQKSYEETLSKYTSEGERKSVIDMFEQYAKERVEELKSKV